MSKTKIFGISTIILLIMIALSLTMWLSLYKPSSRAVNVTETLELLSFTFSIEYNNSYGELTEINGWTDSTGTTLRNSNVYLDSITFELNSAYIWISDSIDVTIAVSTEGDYPILNKTLVRSGNTWSLNDNSIYSFGNWMIGSGWYGTASFTFPVAALVEENPNATTYEGECVDISYENIYGEITNIDTHADPAISTTSKDRQLYSFTFELNFQYNWAVDSVELYIDAVTTRYSGYYTFVREGNVWTPVNGYIWVGSLPSIIIGAFQPTVYAATTQLLATINFPVADLVEEIPYNILTFDPAGGSVTPTTMEVTNGQSIGTLPTPTRSGYRFDGWYIGDTLISSGDTWNYSADQTAVAHWVQQFTVTAGSNNNAQGTVSGTTGALDINSSISLTATPTEHYNFAYWLVNGTQVTSNPYTTTLTSNINAIAYFTPKTYTITPQSEDNARGTVSGGGNITYGTPTTITATPTEHYIFSHWTLNGETVSGAGASYTFPPSGSGTYIAHFTPKQYTITIQSGDTSLGIVSNSLTNRTYDALTQITSTAYISAIGYTLLYWQDDLGNKIYENPLNITLTCNSTYTAVFGKAVELNGICAVDINLINDETNLAVVGTVSMNGYTMETGLDAVHLSAVPSKGYKFEYWTVDGQILTYDGTTPYTAVCDISLELVQGKIVVANFSKIDNSNVNDDTNN